MRKRSVVLKTKNLAFNEDEESIQADRKKIGLLMKGNTQMTAALAQEIYYIIKMQNIRFQSMEGLEFMDSIAQTLTEKQMRSIRNQVAKKQRNQKNKFRFFNINRGMITVLFTAVFLICVAYLNWNFILDIRTNYEAYKLQCMMEDNARSARITQKWKEHQEMEEAARRKKIEDEEAALTAAIQMREPEILVKFKSLHNANNDFAGWLTIGGTKIDYPVMSRQGDNNYYLNKNFEQKEDKNGLLILDYRCDTLQSGQNFIIYGHNMRSGVMFGTLKNYKDKSFCEEHKIIRFDSLYEEAQYEVVAAMLSEVAYADEDVFKYYNAIDMRSEEDFAEFKQNIEKNALYTTGVDIEYGDTCLLLSTCDKYKEDGRFVVIAKKIS